MFDNTQSRFASGGVVQSIPGELIDEVWSVIDQNLKGVFPLPNLLTFQVMNRDGRVSYTYEAGEGAVISVDTDYAFSEQLPETLLAYDNGDQQLILLPSEMTI